MTWVFFFCVDSRDAWLRRGCRRDCGRARIAAPSAVVQSVGALPRVCSGASRSGQLKADLLLTFLTAH
jgi:hypothetical protein